MYVNFAVDQFIIDRGSASSTHWLLLLKVDYRTMSRIPSMVMEVGLYAEGEDRHGFPLEAPFETMLPSLSFDVPLCRFIFLDW